MYDGAEGDRGALPLSALAGLARLRGRLRLPPGHGGVLQLLVVLLVVVLVAQQLVRIRQQVPSHRLRPLPATIVIA